MALQDEVLTWLAQRECDAYLVGGAVRDPVLGREVYDLDVVVNADGLALAQRLADHFDGDFYPLDELRHTGRAILYQPNSDPLVVDVAQFRGPDLAADLADRDFTINALAVDVRCPSSMIDFHGGLADLGAGLIRPVTPDSIRNDPVRALRAVRLAAQLGFVLSAEAVAAIRRDGAGLANVSGERIRDELAHILALPSAASSLESLEELGLLFAILPELEPLRGLVQSPPHHLDALCHSLETVRALEHLLAQLGADDDRRPQVAIPPLTDLEPYARRVAAHLSEVLSDSRSRLVSLKMAALLHDVGKPAAFQIDQVGRVRFIGHENDGAQMAARVLHRLRFSSAEVQLAETIIRNHMRPLLLADQPGVTRRAVYRFFRATGDAGVDVLLHALADHRATMASEAGQQQWLRLLSVVVRMLEDYWEYDAERVNPPSLVNGHDLLSEFGLQPGPRFGDLLEAVREAQATGQVQTREEALMLIRSLVSEGEGLPPDRD